MVARLRPGEPGAKGARRIVRSEARKAIEELKQWPPADDAIHDARKRIKKARAALRLLRTGLGDAEYRRENEAFRDAARPLSEVRDMKILITTLDDLARRASRHERVIMARLREGLMMRRARARRRLVGSQKALQPVVDRLRWARRHAVLPDGSSGWSVLGPSERLVYRAGRRALASAVEKPTDENLHELRKQAKYLGHELRMLAPMEPAAIALMARRARELSQRLGRDHDLALLRNRIAATRGLSRSALRRIVGRIDRSREKLQARALTVGERVYAEAPRAFEKRLGTYWRGWR